MLVNVWVTLINIAVDVILYIVLRADDIAVGLALGYAASYFVGALIFMLRLRRRLTTTHRTNVIQTHVRLVFAAVLAAIPMVGISRLIGSSHQVTPVGAFLTLVLAGGSGLIVFVLVVRRLRVAELDQLRRMLPGRFG